MTTTTNTTTTDLKRLGTKETAARIRADIKNLQKHKMLPAGKFSVTMDSFSGGSSIDVRVVDVDAVMFNVDRFAAEKREPHTFHDGIPWMTPEGDRIMALLKKVGGVYHRDESDIMTDYFNVNFYFNVSAGGQEDKERSAFAATPAAVEAVVEAAHVAANKLIAKAFEAGDFAPVTIGAPVAVVVEAPVAVEAPAVVKVAIFGPNLSAFAQSKGNFHVHAADCGDCKHYGPRKKFGGDDNGDAAVMKVTSKWDAVDSIYGPSAGDFSGTVEENMGDFYFAPCLDNLAVMTAANVAKEATRAGKVAVVETPSLAEVIEAIRVGDDGDNATREQLLRAIKVLEGVTADMMDRAYDAMEAMGA